MAAEQAALIESLRAEVASLRRQAGRVPRMPRSPARTVPRLRRGRRLAAGGRERGAQGGQKGHPGAGLQMVARPDETWVVEGGTWAGRGATLPAAPGRVASSVQILDIPPAGLTLTSTR